MFQTSNGPNTQIIPSGSGAPDTPQITLTEEQQALWERIKAFSIEGDETPALSFAARLARENGWELGYAERVIGEYRRFLFLTRTAGRPVCPSEQVDQAWHQHLIYSRSYWQRLCPLVLKTPLHHEPTRGGPEEGEKHRAMYAQTLDAYRRFFGEQPPEDIWPPAERRFGHDLFFRRVNTKDVWLLRKPRPRTVFACSMVALLAALIAAYILRWDLPWSLFGPEGIAFKPFYLSVWGAALVAGLWLRRQFAGPGLDLSRSVPPLDMFELAFLAGGRSRLVATVLTKLQAQGHALVSADGLVSIGRDLPADADAIETAVMTELKDQAGSQLYVKPMVEVVKDIEPARFARLRALGLILSPAAQEAGKLRPLALGLGPVVLLGGPRVLVEVAHGHPVGSLILMLVLTAAVSFGVLGRRLRATRKASALISSYDRTLRDERAPWSLNTSDIAMAVAAAGVTVLSGTAYAGIQEQFSKTGGTGTAGGCGGCGGCGGGGCGGCGGCGGG